MKCQFKGCKEEWKGAIYKRKKVCKKHYNQLKHPPKQIRDYYLGKMKVKRKR